jgi:outer membrane protein OmpA-like peptidoglycan-associated protein
MLLSLASYGSHGAEDIYVCFRIGTDIWTEPKNLGGVINTDFQEMTPYLAPDNRTLFFASNGHGGFGGRDIFLSQRLDDSWINWSRPVNLGATVNSEGVELYFQYLPGNEYAVFTSTQNSDGYSDFKIVKVPQMELEKFVGKPIAPEIDATGLPIPELIENKVGESGVRLFGNLINDSDLQPVAGSLEISNANWNTQIFATEAGYQIFIPEPGLYDIVIKSDQFVSKLEILDLRATIETDVRHDFSLQPIEVGTTVNLDDVLFVRGSTELIESSESQLDLVVEMMKDNPKMAIELSGHTDNQGNERLNKILSQDRVNEVIDYLIAQGIERTRLSGIGYGGATPIASNESEETRKLNRRVEFTIVKK